jgi:hypothetical protein
MASSAMNTMTINPAKATLFLSSLFHASRHIDSRGRTIDSAVPEPWDIGTNKESGMLIVIPLSCAA